MGEFLAILKNDKRNGKLGVTPTMPEFYQIKQMSILLSYITKVIAKSTFDIAREKNENDNNKKE